VLLVEPTRWEGRSNRDSGLPFSPRVGPLPLLAVVLFPSEASCYQSRLHEGSQQLGGRPFWQRRSIDSLSGWVGALSDSDVGASSNLDETTRWTRVQGDTNLPFLERAGPPCIFVQIHGWSPGEGAFHERSLASHPFLRNA
jgi:hypothetical protein